MENNFYGNGQQNGWQTSPPNSPYGYYNYGAYVNSDYYKNLQKSEREKKLIKKIGTTCGIGALLYLVFAYTFSFAVAILSKVIKPLQVIFSDLTATHAFDAITSVLSLGLPFFLVYLILRRKKLVKALPYEKPKNIESAKYLTMLSVPVMVFSSLFVNYISAIVQTILGVEFNSNLSDTKLSGIGSIIIIIVSMSVVPALMEEFVVRGVVLQPLRKFGDKFAIIVSALFFSMLHGNMLQIPYTFVGGLILGYLAVKTKSLWPPMILHFVNNFYSVIVMIVSDNFSDKAANYTAYGIWVLFAVLGVVGFIGYMKNQEKTSLHKSESILSIKEKVVAFIKNGPMIVAIIVYSFMAIKSIAF